MLGHTHMLFGIATVVAAEVAVRAAGGGSLLTAESGGGSVSAEPALCLTAALLGSLAPDLDAEDSTIQRELGFLGVLTHLGLNLLGVKHRGVLHSGLAMLLVMVAAGALGWWLEYLGVGMAFGLGYLSHVAFADALTVSGVPLWWPGQRRFHLLPGPLRVRTGGPVEKVVALGVAILLVWLLPQAIPSEWIGLVQRLMK